MVILFVSTFVLSLGTPTVECIDKNHSGDELYVVILPGWVKPRVFGQGLKAHGILRVNFPMLYYVYTAAIQLNAKRAEVQGGGGAGG